MALAFDPIEEARRQWSAHGWGALEAMSAATTITRAHQVVLDRINKALKPEGLTFSRYEALVLLAFSRRGALPLGKMAERLMVHSTSITNTIDLLERDGFVRRNPDPSDRRIVLAELTPAGRSVVRRATDALVAIEFGVPDLDAHVVDRLGDAVTHARGRPMIPLDPNAEAVGRVLGTDDATPLEFWAAVAPGQSLQLDDVVVLERVLPTGEVVRIAGMVANVRARQEGARFDSDVFLIADGVLPGEVSEAAQITPTRFEPEIFVPPLPGTPVHLATGEVRAHALFFDQMQNRLPAGMTRDGEPVFLNLDFLDGTRGAHVNISGISGVATKTSYATFLLFSLFHSGVLGAESINTKALIFNVKGEDLLFLDHANSALEPAQRAKYAAMGLPAAPFHDLGVYAPPVAGDANARPQVSQRDRGVAPFYWTVAEFCRDQLLPFLFADAEDDRQQYTIVVHNVAAQLAQAAIAREDGSVTIDGTRVSTFRGLVDTIENHLDPDVPDMFWGGRAIGTGTINVFIRRLHAAIRSVDALVRARPSNSTMSNAVDFDKHQVTVVDIHNLHDRAKRFVVGVVLRQAFERKERSGLSRPLQLVVLDELNKYAPRDGSSPIKEILLDIAERGRSLGIILIGAQQTASEVERRIVANSSIRVVGRLDTAEARRDEYGFLPVVQRQRATILKPGSMFVSQPEIPVPLLTEFPFPAWATRKGEAGGVEGVHAVAEPVDPFAGIT